MARPGGNPNLRNTNGFDKNPQNINTTGLNRKTWSAFNKKCKEKGIEPLTKSSYFDAVTFIMSLTPAEIEEELQNKENPQWMIWLIETFKNIKTRDKLMSEYRDWCFGKAQENVNVSGEIDNNITIDISIDGKKIINDED